MRTKLRKEGSTTIVTFEGKIDFETADKMRQGLVDLEKKTRGTEVIFDFARLQFVGSSGISAFLNSLREFNERSEIRPKYMHVQAEFRRMIQAFGEAHAFEFWDDSAAGRLRRFEN